MNILLIDGGKAFNVSSGRLNHTLQAAARECLTSLGHHVRETVVDDGYEVAAELDKLLWADVWVWQMPGWWMGEPWIVKKYMDEVLTAGYGSLYENDGRHRDNPTKNYGKGGLVPHKKYMFSLTWNAPREAFTDSQEFFQGKGIDELYLHLHKAHEFLGMRALPSYVCYDVVKNPNVPQFIADYQTHLERLFR